MKNFNFIKLFFLLFSVLTLSMCEDAQHKVGSDFETILEINGVGELASFKETGETNFSELLRGSSSFIDAEIEEVTITLQDDYDGDSIAIDLTITVGTSDLVKTNIVLEKNKGTVIQANDIDLLPILYESNNVFSYSVEAKTSNEEPIGDDDFSIEVAFKVNAII